MPCPWSVPRWYYDVTTGECKSFMYGSCYGNNNRFINKEECEDFCINTDNSVKTE